MSRESGLIQQRGQTQCEEAQHDLGDDVHMSRLDGCDRDPGTGKDGATAKRKHLIYAEHAQQVYAAMGNVTSVTSIVQMVFLVVIEPERREPCSQLGGRDLSQRIPANLPRSRRPPGVVRPYAELLIEQRARIHRYLQHLPDLLQRQTQTSQSDELIEANGPILALGRCRHRSEGADATARPRHSRAARTVRLGGLY